MTSNKPEFIKPHVEIKDKATFIGEEAGRKMLEKADKIVETMQDDYVEWSKQDVDKLKNILKEIKSTPESASAKIQELLDVANDMKTQGGSFNYNLVTFIGHSLCKFLQEKQSMDDKAIETIQIHIDTIIMVLNRNITGDGGPMGKEILEGIKAVVQKILAQEQKSHKNQ
ncbi:MAG: hypothetical protein GY804_06515 [Alphaproteobacteria bacterium]|nr:hypothetical protein [Alphaproteobacteria bacterium]